MCGLSAIICEICEKLLGFVCANRLSLLACYSPADYADDAEECSKLHYFAEKDRLGWLLLFLLFCCLGFVCVNQRDQREIQGFSFVQID